MRLKPDEVARELLADARNEAQGLLSKAELVAVNVIKDAKISISEGYAVIANDISYIKRDIGDIKSKLENNYVSKDEFTPVRNIVYGLVGILGIATIGAILKLILKV